MRGYFKILVIVGLFLLMGSLAYASEEEPGADFSTLKEYKGANYTIIYPGKGYEQQLGVLVKRLNKIIPFVESYGVTKFQNIQVGIIKNSDELGETIAGTAEALEEKINIPASYYNENVVVHEVCHLAEHPLIFPPWFAEGQAENCARKYYESVGEYDRVKVYEEFYGSRMVNLKNVSSNVPDWTNREVHLPAGDEPAKTTLDSYLLMGELTGSVGMDKILPKMRQDFVIKESGVQKPYGDTLPNNAIICKINEVAPKDVSGLFEKYGFKLEPCSEKTYDFLKSPTNPNRYLIPILIFWGLVIIAIVIFLKKRKH